MVAVTVKVTVPPTGQVDGVVDVARAAGRAGDAPRRCALAVQVTPVRAAGKVSVTVAPVTALGPALVTTMV